MGRAKPVIALFFGCALLALLTLSQSASSQSITTLSTVQSFSSNSIATVTSTLTTAVVTPQIVHFDLTPSGFNNGTGTFLLGYSETGAAPYYPQDSLCLMYDYFLLNVTTAYEFKIHFDTQQDIPIHFLILDMEQFNRFNHTNCGTGFFGWQLKVVAPMSDLVWVVPQRGEYALLFLSRQFIGGYIHLTLQAYGEVAQVSTYTVGTTSIIQMLSTQTTRSTVTITTPVSTDYSAAVIAAIFIVLALAAAAILRIKRRRPLSPE